MEPAERQRLSCPSGQFSEVWIKAEPVDDEVAAAVLGDPGQSPDVGTRFQGKMLPDIKMMLEGESSMEPEDLSIRSRSGCMWAPAAKGNPCGTGESDGAALKVSGGGPARVMLATSALPWLVWNNYKYRRVRTNKTFVSWRCAARDCGRWLQTDLGHTRVVSEPAYGHAHASDLQLAQRPVPDFANLHRTRDAGSLRSALAYIRRKHGLVLPRDVLELQERPENWCSVTYSRKTASPEDTSVAASLP